jgi:hypothetical protein
MLHEGGLSDRSVVQKHSFLSGREQQLLPSLLGWSGCGLQLLPFELLQQQGQAV